MISATSMALLASWSGAGVHVAPELLFVSSRVCGARQATSSADAWTPLSDGELHAALESLGGAADGAERPTKVPRTADADA